MNNTASLVNHKSQTHAPVLRNLIPIAQNQSVASEIMIDIEQRSSQNIKTLDKEIPEPETVAAWMIYRSHFEIPVSS